MQISVYLSEMLYFKIILLNVYNCVWKLASQILSHNFYLSFIAISLVEQNTTAGSSVESTKKGCTVFNRRSKSGDSIFESGDKVLANKGLRN